MSFLCRSLVALVLVATALPAVAQTAAHYGDGQAAYPPGVNDPARANPAPPPTEIAVPLPQAPDTPLRSAPSVVPAGWTSESAPVSIGGPGSPAYAQPSPVLPTVAPPADLPLLSDQPARMASWYTRIDYFHWNERIAGADFVNEEGSLFTLGYQRRIGSERFRAEIFGGDVHYDGYGEFDAGAGLQTLVSNTGYLGLRGEYEMIFEPAVWEGHVDLMAGLGTRFWIRDLHDAATDLGTPIYGYQETWWTTYPYLGVETHSSRGREVDFYSESRVGMTALNYEFASIGDRPLWPRPGVVANVELGLRGDRFYLAARGEVMSWEASSVVEDAYQPHSVMYTVGGRLGVMF